MTYKNPLTLIIEGECPVTLDSIMHLNPIMETITDKQIEVSTSFLFFQNVWYLYLGIHI